MLKNAFFKFLFPVLLAIALTGCGQDVKVPDAYKPISAGEKFDAKEFRHGKLIHTMLAQEIHSEDIDRHLYLLEAIIRQVEVYEKCARVAADLSLRAIQSESEAVGKDLPNKRFIEGQTAYIQEDMERARSALEAFLDQSKQESSPLMHTARLYLQAIEAGVQFAGLFQTSTGETSQILPGCLEGKSLPTSDLLIMDYNFFELNEYDCGGDKPCSWETPDLSIYPYLKARLLSEGLSYTENTFTESDSKEGVFFELLSSIVKSYSSSDPDKVNDIIQDLESKDLSHKRPFATYYQIAKSLRPIEMYKIGLDEDQQPLMLLRSIRTSENGAFGKTTVSMVYEAVLPSLFNASFSTEYRDYVYVELWNYLWKNDKDLLEQFRLNKGYSPGVVAPDFFLDLLPYRVTHPRETRLGNKDLKTQIQHHPYLRPLISSYEYISEKSTPDNTGKTGVG